ncbi:hypothetical protein MKX08_002766 [Trichoderma sp. CBMAI-0020]|nr:hypothetical protein MKX08_002766 [Trichoderma sp. CBMAI-0020]
MADDFEFILHEPNKRLSRDTHRKIRKHAMKAAGAARRIRNVQSKSPSKGRKLVRKNAVLSPPPPMPLSGLELLVKDIGLDPINFSSLTSVHLGPVASTLLHRDSGQLPGILIDRQWSYFSFIPPRFGHVAALDDAFRCLITAAHSLLVPNDSRGDEVMLHSYGKALQSLQQAIYKPNNRYAAETLCAMGILSIVEILNCSKGKLWFHHIAGAAQLIRFRGPEEFTSDFDIALLLSLSFPICAEALLNDQECFLDNPKWAQAIQNATSGRETFMDRSPLGIRLLILLTKLPGLVKKTCHVVAVQNTLRAEDFDSVAAGLRELRSNIAVWRREFNMALIHANNKTNPDKRYEFLGTCIVIQIFTSRLLSSILPNERRLLEEEAQCFAMELKHLHESVGPRTRDKFLLTQKARIANAAIDTRDDFAATVGNGRIVEAWRLKRFCSLFGRKFCDGITCCTPDG